MSKESPAYLPVTPQIYTESIEEELRLQKSPRVSWIVRFN